MSDAAAREGDRRSRELAQREFERPMLLRAGAGTGKTQVLVARTLAWCLGPGWLRAEHALGRSARAPEIAARVFERVVAITFTEAAAAEMETRIADALGALARGEHAHVSLRGVWLETPPGARERERAGALLAAFDALTVRTIHAFCRRLLAAHALEAGLHPAFEVDPELARSAEVAREVMLEKLRTAFVEPDPTWLELMRLGLSPSRLEEVLIELIRRAVKPAVLEPDPFAPARVAAFHGELSALYSGLLDAGLDRLRELPQSSRSARTARRLEALASPLDDSGGAVALDAYVRALVAEWEEADGDRLQDWAEADFTQRERRALGPASTAAFAEAVRRACPAIEGARRLRPRELDVQRRALLPLLARTRALLRSRGVLGFDDLLVETRALLDENAAVREAIRRDIDQLLVDEFQDTDAVQCAILARLGLEAPGRPGLFLVGDPQQSIYGFRNADLAAYEGFRALLVRAGGVLAELRINHRSVPAVLDAVRVAIAPLMREAPGVQPGFAALLPSAERARDRGFTTPPWSCVEYWNTSSAEELAGGPQLQSAERSALEADALARELARLGREGGVRWREVAVLLRARGELDAYLEALREQGVPYVVEGDRGFYRRREVIDAISLVRAVVDPMDQISLCGWLRSPAVGVPDAAWIPLAGRDVLALLAGLRAPAGAELAELERRIRDAAAELSPAAIPGLDRVAGFEEILIEAVETLAVLRASFASDPPDLFVEKLRTHSLIEPMQAARPLGEYGLANLERFFRDLCADLCEAAGDARRVLRALRRRERAALLAEEGRPPEDTADAVRVLTIHGAKGLDFEHVYLVQTHRQRGGREEPTLSRVTHDPLPEYALAGAPTLRYYRARERAEQVERAESVRALYVALTRARRRLVICMPWRGGDSAPPPERAGSLRDLLLHRPDLPDADALRAAAQRAIHGAAHLDGGGVRFVAIALGQRELDQPRARRPLAPPDDRDLALEARRLREAVAAAQARMALPFARAAARASGEPEEHPDAGGTKTNVGAEQARALGTALHRALETLELGLPRAPALERLQAETARGLAESLPAPALAGARARADALFERLARGRLLARLHALRTCEHYRELALLAPPEPAAVGYLSGVIDLLYRDPEREEWVVVDYKTDRIESNADLERLCELHAPQALLYGRAVQGALALERPPRLELWWLDRDQASVLRPSGQERPRTATPAATLARP